MSYLILVVLLALAIPVGMAKRRRRKRYRRYIKGRIDFELALLTLAGNDVLSAAETNVLTETAYLSSIKASWSIQDMVASTAQGPLWVGLAHSDYTAAEIEEWIEEGASWSEGDMIATREINKRLIRQVGTFMNLAAGTANVNALNEGRPITTKCGWVLTTGQTVQFWVYNSGTGTLTTGATVHVNGHANLWPN